MFADEFEKQLKALDTEFYFESPSLFVAGADKDAESYTAEQTIDIMKHDIGKFAHLIRKRSEQVGKTTYYFKDTLNTTYLRIVVANATGAGGRFDLSELKFQISQTIDTFKVRNGWW